MTNPMNFNKEISDAEAEKIELASKKAAEKRTGKSTEQEKPTPVPVQFKIPKAMKTDLKMMAIQEDTDMTQLFIKMYEFYKANHK